MKFHRVFGWVVFFLYIFSFSALADDAGVLTERELSDWVSQILYQSKDSQPQNMPVGEEAHTDEGYAFMYPFATLYYNKPELDQASVLRGFAVTEEAASSLRGLSLGTPLETLIATYGWQNPELYHDGSFAVLYQLNQLPKSAYWAWARLEDEKVSMVQCAVHALVGEELYTDAGVEYQIQDGVIVGIRVYGLDQLVNRSVVEGNLGAVIGAQTASLGDETHLEETPVEGYFQENEGQPFGRDDLLFAGIDFLALTPAQAPGIFGTPQQEEWAQDDTGEWLLTLRHEKAVLTFAANRNKENPRLESISFLGTEMQGPRSVRLGDTLEAVLVRFPSDGNGAVNGNEALLYGDGKRAPYGAMSQMQDMVTLRYVTQVQNSSGITRDVTLHLFFQQGGLAEISVYSW